GRSDESGLVEACPSWSPRRPWRGAAGADNGIRAPQPWAFTLVVTAIIGSLMVLVTPAFDPTRLVQVTRLVKIENLHLPLFAVGSGTGDTFDMRLLFSSTQAESVTMIPDLLIVSSANLSVSTANNRRTRKSKTQRRGRLGSGATTSAAYAHPERELAAPDPPPRTKALLLAALRVWELKNRISD